MSEIQTWENKVNRVALRKGCGLDEVLREDMRCSIREKEIKGQVDRYPTYRALRQRIEQDTFLHTTGPAPMINHTEAETEEGVGDAYYEALNAFNKFQWWLCHVRLPSGQALVIYPQSCDRRLGSLGPPEPFVVIWVSQPTCMFMQIPQQPSGSAGGVESVGRATWRLANFGYRSEYATTISHCIKS